MDDKEKLESSINTQSGFVDVGFYVQPSSYGSPVNLYPGLGTDRIFNKPANIPIHMPVDYGVLRTSDKENKTDK